MFQLAANVPTIRLTVKYMDGKRKFVVRMQRTKGNAFMLLVDGQVFTQMEFKDGHTPTPEDIWQSVGEYFIWGR